jgi:hypothetical protein
MHGKLVFEEEYTYLRIYGVIVSPHLLPIYVPNRLVWVRYHIKQYYRVLMFLYLKTLRRISSFHTNSIWDIMVYILPNMPNKKWVLCWNIGFLNDNSKGMILLGLWLNIVIWFPWHDHIVMRNGRMRSHLRMHEIGKMSKPN